MRHTTRSLLLLVPAILAATASCTLLLDTDRTQCAADADCAPAGAGFVCRAAVCVAGGPVAQTPDEGHQGPRSRATRNPAIWSRMPGSAATREAARTRRPGSLHEPPRNTRRASGPHCVLARPSRGRLGLKQLAVHSQTFPCMSKSPKPLGLKLPTGAVCVNPSRHGTTVQSGF